MATVRPYAGYSAWENVPETPVKYKLDWPKICVWVGVLTFCLSCWAGLFRICMGRL